MACRKISDDLVNLLSEIKLPSERKTGTSEESDEPQPTTSRSDGEFNEPQPSTSQSKEDSSEYESIESNQTVIEVQPATTQPAETEPATTKPDETGPGTVRSPKTITMIVYYSSVFQSFFRTPKEAELRTDVHHAPRMQSFLKSDLFLSKVNIIKKLVIDASNQERRLKSFKLNAQFGQLVYFEARFINFEEYKFLSSPNISAIFLDAVSFGKLPPYRWPIDEFSCYEAPFALLPKNQVKAFASCDYLDWNFFNHVLTEQILNQVDCLDRIHLNVKDGRQYAHHILYYISRKTRFVNLTRVNLYIGKTIDEFSGYLNNFRGEFELACFSFVLRKGTLRLFGIPISQYTDVRPVLDFFELLFKLMKLQHLVEINPTFLYFALCRQACSLIGRLSSKLCPTYRYLIRRFYSSVEVLQCTDTRKLKIFENFGNVWGLKIRLKRTFFTSLNNKTSFYQQFLRQFPNRDAICSLVVTSKVSAFDNTFLDLLPDFFCNLHSLSIEVKVKIGFGFISEFACLSTLNMLLEHSVTAASFLDLIRAVKRLVYLRVESKMGPNDGPTSFDEFKEEAKAVLQELDRDYLEFSYRIVKGVPFVQRIVEPITRKPKVRKLPGEPRSTSV